jgi:hypothetical protein
VQRIAEGRGADFMRGSVLKEHREAPVAVRLSTIMLEPVSLKEHFETGAWWKRSYIGPHTPPRELDPHFWQDFLPEPEMWHFEAIFWRGRSKLGRLMERSRAGEDPMTLALADARDLSAADVERFWNDFMPHVTRQDRTRFDGLPELVAVVRKRYEHRELRAFYRLLGRFSALLVARLEPHYLGRGFSPPLPAKTYLHLWMLVHDVIANGKQAYLDAMADPLSLAKRAEALDVPSGLYLLGIFRFEALVFDAQKLRLITAIMPPHDEEAKALIARGEGMTDFERVVARLAERFAGFFDVMQVVRRSFLGPRFDHGFPEQYPVFEQLDSGEVVLKRRGQSATDSAVAPQRV